MTGQTDSPRALVARMSSTARCTRASITAKTSSTVRPDAAIRARSACLISAVAAARSVGVLSQCGNAGRRTDSVGCAVVIVDPFGNGSLLVRSTVRQLPDSGKSLYWTVGWAHERWAANGRRPPVDVR